MRSTGGIRVRRGKSKSGAVSSQDIGFSLQDLDATKLVLQHDDDRLHSLKKLLAREWPVGDAFVNEEYVVGALVASQMSAELALERLKRLHVFYAEEAGTSMKLASEKYLSEKLIIISPLDSGTIVYFNPPDMLSATGFSALFLGAFEYVDVSWGAITLVLHLTCWNEEDVEGGAGISFSLRLLPLHIKKIIFVDAPDHVIAQNYETADREVVHCASFSEKLFHQIPEKELLTDMGGFKSPNDFPTNFKSAGFFSLVQPVQASLPRGGVDSPRLMEDSDTVELDDDEPDIDFSSKKSDEKSKVNEDAGQSTAAPDPKTAGPAPAKFHQLAQEVASPKKANLDALFDEMSSSEEEGQVKGFCKKCGHRVCQCSRIDKPIRRRKGRRKKKSGRKSKVK